MSQRLWTRQEEIIVFNLYCKIPFQRSSKYHPDVIKIADLIGRTPSAVNMKIGNFGSFDDTLNALHDKAFDRGFITVTTDYRIIVSSSITDICDGKSVETFFSKYNNAHIAIPEKFAPNPLFLQYHNDSVFEMWR